MNLTSTIVGHKHNFMPRQARLDAPGTLHHVRTGNQTLLLDQLRKVKESLDSTFKAVLEKNGVALKYWHHYLKWLRHYLDFCRKYQFDRISSDSLEPFIQKLSQKKQTEQQRQQACQAVQFFHQMAQLQGKLKPGPGELNTSNRSQGASSGNDLR